MLFVDATAGVVLSVAVLWCAYALTCRWFPDVNTSTRLTAAAVLLFWQLTAAFLLLSAVKLFVAPVSIAGWVCAAILAHRAARRVVDPFVRLDTDLAAARAWWRVIGTPMHILLGVGGAVVAARLAHGLLAPCMTWDALTYHLYRPAVWAQSHGYVSTWGPDAASYYTWFPVRRRRVGWWLQTMRGDVAIARGSRMWLLVPLATYVRARAMGAPPIRATAAATALRVHACVIVPRPRSTTTT